MNEVVMENRACSGIRLVSERILEGNREYVYTIGWHVPIGMFYLEEQTTYLDRKPIPETYGGIIAFSKRVRPLIKHIEEIRGVKIKLKEDTSAQEQYDIAEGERLLKKYPKWKTEPGNIPVLE
jgi:hypothetical protein